MGFLSSDTSRPGGEIPVQCILREPCELRLTNAHDRRVVAALEINIRRIMHALVHDDVEAIALADRRDGPVRAIGE